MGEHISNLVENKLKKIKEEKNVFDTGKVIRLKDYSTASSQESRSYRGCERFRKVSCGAHL